MIDTARARPILVSLFSILMATACGGSGENSNPLPHPGDAGDAGDAGAASETGEASNGMGTIQNVFVVAMENHDQTQIIGDTTDAPYINGTLVPAYASTSKFTDLLPLAIPSEPHYVWMEAGTNVFSDHTFTSDDDPSATNSTASTDHLAAQMIAAGNGLTFLSYQEGLNDMTGACPIHSAGFYAAKHDPIVFFQDIAGNPPAADNAACAAYHKEIGALSGDLASGSVARYSFITPNLCNDMHGQGGCPNSNTIQAGDQWFAANLPPIIDFVNAHNGVIFLVWDEGNISQTMPFFAIGPSVKKGYVSAVDVSQSSLVKTIERIFGLATLSTVAAANDLSDLFMPGALP